MNHLSYTREKVDVGFDQFIGFCLAIDGKKLLFDGFTFIDCWTVKNWTENRVIVNMCTCSYWECDSVIAEVKQHDNFIIWELKGYRTGEDYGEFKFEKDNYCKVIHEIQRIAAAERNEPVEIFQP